MPPTYRPETLNQLAKCQKLLSIVDHELLTARHLMQTDGATIVDAELFIIAQLDFTLSCAKHSFKRLLETRPPTPPSSVTPPTIQLPHGENPT